MVSIFRHGINNDNIGPIAKASFEETPEMFLRAAKHAEVDLMRGVSSNIMCGQDGYFGTGSFQVVLDMDEVGSFHSELEHDEDDELINIENEFGEVENPDDPCNLGNISIQTNAENIKTAD